MAVEFRAEGSTWVCGSRYSEFLRLVFQTLEPFNTPLLEASGFRVEGPGFRV